MMTLGKSETGKGVEELRPTRARAQAWRQGMAKMLSCSVAAPALTGETLYITCLCAESRQVGGTDDEHSEAKTDICARSRLRAEVAGLQGSSLSLSLCLQKLRS